MTSVELFAGAGGSALGIASAGFRHEAVVERDRHCCATLIENQRRGHALSTDWTVYHADVRYLDYTEFPTDVRLLAGGPPCQPFSLGGKHRAWSDDRDMFPELVRAVRALTPEAVLVENVKGLLRESFSSYFEYIVLRLTYPEMVIGETEDWREHLYRLERHHTRGRDDGLRYNVVYQLLNAADYGVPQKRERVIIVAFRSDLGVKWSFPRPTHSLDALVREQWVTREYWARHDLPAPSPPPGLRSRIRRVSGSLPLDDALPWRTVRDALEGLPSPSSVEGRSIANHEHRCGARPYPGHTGSPLDEPAKVLKAGDHGVPGGENMLADTEGRVRYFTAREAARIQTFPDEYVLVGSWTETMRQLGNAVPVRLAEVIARDIRRSLDARSEAPPNGRRRTLQPAGEDAPRRERGSRPA